MIDDLTPEEENAILLIGERSPREGKISKCLTQN
jgi:hypothetical protein